MKTIALSMLALLFVLFPAPEGNAGEPFACNAKALTGAERTRHEARTRAVLAAVSETSELPGGYAFRLPPASLVDAAEWVALERKCCPFLVFEIRQEKDGGPVWLRVTGAPGVKEFLKAELTLP